MGESYPRQNYYKERYKRKRAHILKIGAEWKKKNPDKNRKHSQKWVKNNPVKARETYLKWAKANPEKVKKNQSVQNRRFRKIRRLLERGATGSHSVAEWENLKAQYNWTCPCCHRSEPEIKLTEDHIIPLIKGGSDNIENIQPLCKSCNSKKYTKIIKYEFKHSG